MTFIANTFFFKNDPPLFPYRHIIKFTGTVYLNEGITMLLDTYYDNNSVRQHNCFYYTRYYIDYLFRLLNSHLQDYFLQLSHKILCTHWDPSVFTSVKYLSQIMIWLKSQDSVHTLGSQYVYISEILKPDHDLA